MKRQSIDPEQPNRIPRTGEASPLELVLEHLATEPVDDEDELREAVWASEQAVRNERMFAGLRRRLMPSERTSRPPAPITPELRAFSRVDLVERVEALRRIPGNQFAHLHLSALSDDDLRQLIAELESTERSQS